MRRLGFLVLSLLVATTWASGPAQGASGSTPLPQPPAGRIAFASDRQGGIGAGSDIYVMNADGTDLAKLTSFSKWAFLPTWSPDGSRIAFTGIRPPGGPGSSHQIYVMNADGSGIKRITRGTTQSVAPTWSPDGTQISFVRKPPLQGQVPAHIAVMNPDGTGVTELTSGPDFDYRSTWSPDGSRIAFERYFVGGGQAIFIMNRDGSGLTKLLDGSGFLDPTWSPDGTRIAFWNVDELRAVDVVTGHVTTIAKARQLGGVVQPLEWSSWSPDGQWLVLAGCCEESADMYLVAADGSGASLVPNGEAASGVSWGSAAA